MRRNYRCVADNLLLPLSLPLLLLLLGSASRVVVIKGRPDSVQRATAMVKELISGEPGTASQIIAKVGPCAHELVHRQRCTAAEV
jgi:hypothetical protein